MAWRSSLINFLDQYPVLQYLEDRADTQSIVAITVLDRETNTTLSLSDLEIIYEAMTMDLSDKFDWDQVNNSHITADKELQLTINKLYDQTHWEQILKYICYIGRPIKFSDKEGLLRISLDCETFRSVHAAISKNIYPNLVDDEIIVKKIAFLAHNFTQLKKILGKETSPATILTNPVTSPNEVTSSPQEPIEATGYNHQPATAILPDRLQRPNQATSIQDLNRSISLDQYEQDKLKREIGEIYEEIQCKETQIKNRLEVLSQSGDSESIRFKPSKMEIDQQ